MFSASVWDSVRSCVKFPKVILGQSDWKDIIQIYGRWFGMDLMLLSLFS